MEEMSKLFPGIKENISLKEYTTFKIGGPAKYFFEAKNKEKLLGIIKKAKNNNLPFFILGGGSNLLISDQGYDGLVIKVDFKEIEIKGEEVFSGAGASLPLLAKKAAEEKLTGLEWAVGIPSSVGGAVYGNAGAFGESMEDNVEEVEALDSSSLEINKYFKGDCNFDYRTSIFKEKKDLIILSVKLRLEKGNKEEIDKKIKENIEKRKEKQPLEFPSAGSIFKNPPNHSAGALIDQCGLRGKTIGQAQVSEKHANFIVNLGDAKSEDVISLINLIKERVKEKFNIELEEEVQIIY